MKGRFTAADVRAEVRDLKPIVEGSIVLNVYDVDSKTFLLKLGGATGGASNNKVILLIESGCRFHTTKYVREKYPVPSPFAAKLRKHIRNKRLETLKQIGGDRVVDFVFGSAEDTHHLILELYSSGNIILTDYRYEILQLLRSHKYDDETSVAVRHVYPTNHATVNEKEDQPELDNPDAFLSWLGASSIKASESKRKKNQKRLQLKQLLLRKDSGVSQLGTSIMEHCILQAGLNPSLIIVTTVDGKVKDLCTDNAIALIGTFQEAKRLMNSLSCVSEPGFIIVSDDVEKGRAGSSRVYIEFVPHLLMQHNPNKAISFKSFDTAVDEFFSRAEDQKIQMSIQTAEAAAQKRVQAVRESNEKRISVLHERQEQLLLEATALESSAETAELALSVLRSAVDNGIDWQQLKEHIKAEKIAGNPVAALVTEDLLKLSDGIAVLELPSPCGEDHSVMVSVRLELSAHANVRSIYDDRRRAVQKAERTLAASEKATSAAERYSQRELQNLSLKHSLAMEKKSLWFEKFYWFVSSENYLVLSGRDARQSQVLVSQYLRPCDVYVHTDIEGAHFCIIHNKDVNSPVSPVALLETGCMAVCRSRAWSSRARTSAWWVNADQVVHIAPAAENLPIGISIHGKKNFLPPHQLEMGLGLLFRIDDAGAERHKDERSDRGLSALAASEFGVVATECGVDYSRSCEKNGFATGEVMNTRYDNNSNSVNECDAAGKNGCIAYTFTTSVEGGSQAQRKRGGIGSKPGRSLTATTKGHPPPTQSSQDSLSSSCMVAAEHLVKPQTSDKVPRGKKGKMKLIKKKYRDQDDEDRELALELLGKQRNGGTTKQNALFKQKTCKNGSKKVSALKKDAARQGALKEVVSRMNADAVAQRQRLSEEVQSYLAMLETGGLLPVGGFDYHALQCLEEFESEEALSILKDYSTSNLDTIRNKSGLLLGIIRRYKKKKIQANPGSPLECATAKGQNNISADEKHGKMMLDSAGETGYADSTDVLNILSHLTGMPHVDDTLLQAVPVCAPYVALRDYKYKVKLTPGKQRKGKAVKQAIQAFIQSTTCTQQEYDLILHTDTNEFIATMIGDVKVSMAGLAAVKMASKLAKKVEAKQRVKK